MGAIDPFCYTDYSKITDLLMYFNDKFQLLFSVQLQKKSKDMIGKEFCHKEFIIANKSGFGTTVSVKRHFNMGLIINNMESYNDSAYIRIKDIPVLQYLFKNVIMGWFFGEAHIYDIVDKRLVITGKYKDVDIPLSETSFLSFSPIILDYEDGTSKEGIRMSVNRYDNFCDMSIDKFMEFQYYICNVDFYTAATNLLTYLKTQPYGINVIDMTRQDNYFNKQ